MSDLGHYRVGGVQMYRVFLVDDEEITLMQTAETVPWLDNGFMVAGMESDPVRAVDRIVEEKPEVVFSDLKMPRMDGLELMRRVREKGFYPEFVMLSAYGTFEDARTFFKQEGFDYLLKPMQIPEVELLLEKLTNRLVAKYPEEDLTEDVDQSVNEKFDTLVEHVKKNFMVHQTLEQLSRQFGLSSSYICVLFMKRFHTSLTCFVTKLRMEEAGKRILNSRESCKSIAVSCGYKDYFYFSKVFKGYYGVSPVQYKEEGQKQE